MSLEERNSKVCTTIIAINQGHADRHVEIYTLSVPAFQVSQTNRPGTWGQWNPAMYRPVHSKIKGLLPDQYL